MYSNAGQSGHSIERLYVHKDIADELIQSLLRGIAALPIGDPMLEEVLSLSYHEESNWSIETVRDGSPCHCPYRGGREVRCEGPDWWSGGEHRSMAWCILPTDFGAWGPLE